MILFRFIKHFEKAIILVLVLLMAAIVLSATVSLGQSVMDEIIKPPIGRIDPTHLMDLFGLFLIVFIGIELLDSIKTYIIEKTIHVEMVLLVSIMAVARKVIVFDIHKAHHLSLLGIAAMCIALCLGYFFVRKSHREAEAPNTARLYRKLPE